MERSMLLLVLDLVGIATFAAAGALAGISKRLDLFGVIVIAAVSSLGGGLLRDVLLGDTPPAALQDLRYLVAPIPAALVVFFRASGVQRLRNPCRARGRVGGQCDPAAVVASGMERCRRRTRSNPCCVMSECQPSSRRRNST